MKKHTRIIVLGALVALHGFVQAVVSPTNDEGDANAVCAVACDVGKNDTQLSEYERKVSKLPKSSQVFLKKLEALSLAQRAERIEQISKTTADYFSKIAKAATTEAKRVLRKELLAELFALEELALLDIYLDSQLKNGENNE